MVGEGRTFNLPIPIRSSDCIGRHSQLTSSSKFVSGDCISVHFKVRFLRRLMVYRSHFCIDLFVSDHCSSELTRINLHYSISRFIMADRVVSKVMNNLCHLTYEAIIGKEDHVFDVVEYTITFNPLLAWRGGRKPFSLCMPMGVWRCGNTTKKRDDKIKK
jgi:hypothetical protein